jgi:hypothetical protein
MIQDHEPLQVTKVGGLYSRDSFYDTVPRDHWIDSLNMDSGGDSFGSRDGFSKTITLSNLRQIEIYKREGEASRYLLLNSSGSIFDSANSLVTPILTIATMTGFSIQTVYNRCYITPHNGTKGLSGQFVYVYQGSTAARKAAGLAPVGTFTATLNATGHLDAGTHLIAVCYETDTGFITPPGEVAEVETDGTQSVDLTVIPVGPTGTAKRHVLCSQAIQDYNGNTLGYEMFFVPNGTISDNVTTTFSVNIYDEELITSADYTFDQLEELPAGCSLGKYQTRLVICGPNTNASLVYISKDTEPESFSSLSGFLVCDPFETEGIKNCLEFRDTLYLFKGNPGHTYATQDNGYDPSTWDCPRIDSAIGADLQGVAQFTDSKGSNSDFFVVADVSGLYYFNGAYSKQFPLSWKIQKIWDRINKLYMNAVKVVLDPTSFRIFLCVPLDSATTPSHILVADYADGLDADNIKWHIWNSAAFACQSIAINLDSTTKKNVLTVCGTSNVYKQVPAQYNDENSAIDYYFISASMYEEENWIHHFSGIGLNISGVGTLTCTTYTKDLAVSAAGPSLILSATPGRQYLLPINVQNEKCAFKLRINTIDKYFKCRNYTLYARPIFATRPA